MRVRLIVTGVGLMIIGIVLAAVLAFTTWGNQREYWIEVETDTVGGGAIDQSPNFFETHLSAGYYALTASGGLLSNNSLVTIGGTLNNASMTIVSRSEGLVQEYGITPGNPVYFQIDYDDTYAFYFTYWYPVVATISKQMHQGEISYRNLSPIGVLIALVGVVSLIVGAISTPSEPGTVGGRNTMIRLMQQRARGVIVGSLQNWRKRAPEIPLDKEV